jgi:hypothetical protein
MGAPQYEQAGADVSGSGTTNTIPRWTGPTTLGDSIITQTGTSRITVGSGSYAGASLDGVRLVNGVNSYFAASDGTRTVFMGADGNAVVGTLTAHDLKIRAGNADAMIVQQGTLNVGIGTPAPVGRADVAGTSVNQLAWGLLSVRSNDAQGADKGGSIAFGGIYDASNTTHWAQISGRKENGTSGQYGGYLAFATRTDGAGTNTERARIDSSGVLTTTDLATYSLSGTTASVASGGTSAALFTPAASSEYIVYIQATSNTGVMAHAMVLQNGAASGALVSVVGSVLCTINNAAGALTITNNSGSAETFRWRALKLRSLV